MSKIQDALLENETEKSALEKIQQAYDEMKAREESRGLARMSHILVSIWQIVGIISKLPEGHSLVIDRDGYLFTGRVKKLESMKKLTEKIVPKRQSLAIDAGMFERVNTKSSVYTPGPTWKNSWDKIRTKLVTPPDEFLPAAVGIFLLEVDEISPEELTIAQNKNGLDWNFTEITWNKYPEYTIGLSEKLGTIRYWKLNGETHWIDA